jgi:hypothetical protein
VTPSSPKSVNITNKRKRLGYFLVSGFAAAAIICYLLIAVMGDRKIGTSPDKSSDYVSFVDDDFTEYPFGNVNLKSLALSSENAVVNRKPLQNPHDASQTDTIITINTVTGSEYKFYKYKDEESLTEATILDGLQGSMKRNINIGMTYGDFSSRFSNPLLVRTGIKKVVVTDSEENVVIGFYFDSTNYYKLEKITYFVNPI